MSRNTAENQTAEYLHSMVSPLLSWYEKNARVLPWREYTTPYRVWVSEIMLQQTRVEAVKGYYERFLEALPDVEALSKAPEQQLLKLWEGLGYYNRVRNMQKAAQVIMRDYNGELPASSSELKKLAGFGEYTAGAVASIAFGLPAPAVDGNVLRVISRILAVKEEITRPKTKAAITSLVSEIIPADRAGDFTQSLMELGAMVCLPNGEPRCRECPVSGICLAFAQGITGEIPVKTGKKPRKVEERTVLLVVSEEKAAIRKRASGGLLGGLWEFPSADGKLTCQEVERLVRQWGLEPLKLQTLKPSVHIFTHIEWRMSGYLVSVEKPVRESGFVWAGKKQIEEEYPLPSAFQVYTKVFLKSD